MHLKKSNDGKILFYMDVNSMYPYVMTKDVPHRLNNHKQEFFRVTKENKADI